MCKLEKPGFSCLLYYILLVLLKILNNYFHEKQTNFNLNLYTVTLFKCFKFLLFFNAVVGETMLLVLAWKLNEVVFVDIWF